MDLRLEKIEVKVENSFELNLIRSTEQNTNIVDWTHEKEWRVPNNYSIRVSTLFDSSPPYYRFLFPNKNIFEYFLEKSEKLAEEKGTVGFLNWNFDDFVNSEESSQVIILS